MKKARIPVKVVADGFSFEACHCLDKNYEGPCSRLHGHSYKMSVAVKGVPDPLTGMVVDFKQLKSVVDTFVIQAVDHSNLNDVMRNYFSLSEQDNTTCENMIIAFWWTLDHEISECFPGVELDELQLWETAHNRAVLTREMVYNA